VTGKDLAMMKPTAFVINTSRGPHHRRAVPDGRASVSARSPAPASTRFDIEPLPINHPLRKTGTMSC